jgi:hypothetical protein
MVFINNVDLADTVRLGMRVNNKNVYGLLGGQWLT